VPHPTKSEKFLEDLKLSQERLSTPSPEDKRPSLDPMAVSLLVLNLKKGMNKNKIPRILLYDLNIFFFIFL
jgi:hypothetical protein